MNFALSASKAKSRDFSKKNRNKVGSNFVFRLEKNYKLDEICRERRRDEIKVFIFSAN